MTRTSREGFSLVEALVALTIAAMTLTAIFQLQHQMTRGQQRAADTMAQVVIQENALAMIRDINPMAQPEGMVTLPDGDTIRWQSEPKSDVRTNVGYPMGQGTFEVQLFTVTLEVERQSGRSPLPITVDRLGWRRLDMFD